MRTFRVWIIVLVVMKIAVCGVSTGDAAEGAYRRAAAGSVGTHHRPGIEQGTALGAVWVAPSTTRVLHNATPPQEGQARVEGGWSGTNVSMDAARGEVESVALAVRLEVGTPQLHAVVSTFRPTGTVAGNAGGGDGGDAGALPAGVLGRIVGVTCNESAFYTLPSGEYPDAVLFGEAGTSFSAAAHVTHSLLLEVSVGATVAPGNYTAMVTVTVTSGNGSSLTTNVTVGTVPVALRVWAATVPSLIDAAMPTIFNFPYSSNADGATDIGDYYGGNVTSEQRAAWFARLCSERIPPDLPYASTTRSVADMALLSNATVCNGGAPRMALLNVVHAANSSHAPQLQYTQQQLADVVEQLRPVVAVVRNNGWIERAYVYGFDEVSEAYLPGIQQLLGAVKDAFPDLRTVSTLRWTPPLDADFPLDTWNNLYSLWNNTAAAAWKAARPAGVGLKRETFAYHCISPRPPATAPHYDAGSGWLNTFVEYPVAGGRLLLWWAALQSAGVDGWLCKCCQRWSRDVSVCTHTCACAADYLVNGWSATNGYSTLGSNSDSVTDFSAVRPNGKLHGFSNGDGILLYPASVTPEDGVAAQPAPSLRLAALRDGIEDYELFTQAAQMRSGLGPAGVHELINRVLRSGTDYDVDADGQTATAVVMRAVRRAVLAALSAA